MDQKELFDDLIVKYLAGETSDEEAAMLTREIAESDDLANHFLAMKNVWDNAVSPNYVNDLKVTQNYGKVMRVIKQSQRQQRISNLWHYFQRVAAALFLPLIAVTVYMFISGRQPKERELIAVTQEIVSMPGTRIHSLLPDSSEVWLNGGSSITYTQSTESGRSITLNGEAYFKVAKDMAHPFVVCAGDVRVLATGTEFNVCSYEPDSLTTITLTEGSVQVTDPINTISMTPGQMIVYNENLGYSQLYLGNIDKNLSWRHGRLVFKNETLANVFKRIGQIYGLTFEVDPKLCDILFFATFEDVSLEQAMMLIRKSTALEYDAAQASDNRSVIRVKARI